MSDFFSDFRKNALKLGFDECRFATIINQEADFVNYKTWLSNKFHGDMKWIEQNQEFRQNIKNLFPWAKSYAILALNYENQIWDASNSLKISKYAVLNDYHYVFKSKMTKIINSIIDSYPSLQFEFFVDSKPVLERSLAVNAGMGWIGKNSCLIIPKKGSWFFIGGIALNVDCEISVKPIKNQCGSCSKCVDACPTNAIIKPYVIDARKCISYLTIEHKEEIDENLKTNMHGYIAGCDICQNVCPHNRFAKSICNSDLLNDSLTTLDEDTLENMNQSQFKKRFKHTPFLRVGYKKFRRNFEIAKKQIIQ